MNSEQSVLRPIKEIGHHARETRSVGSFAQQVVDILDQRMGFPFGAILVEQPNGALAPVALERPGDESLAADKAHVESRMAESPGGLTRWVAQYGESVRIGDVRDDERYLSMRDDIRSELCVPIRVAGQTLGVINTESTCKDLYSQLGQDLLEVVALEVASVLQTAKLTPSMAPDDGEFVTICSTCKKYRGPDWAWRPIEELLSQTARLQVSHGACPDCLPLWE